MLRLAGRHIALTPTPTVNTADVVALLLPLQLWGEAWDGSFSDDQVKAFVREGDVRADSNPAGSDTVSRLNPSFLPLAGPPQAARAASPPPPAAALPQLSGHGAHADDSLTWGAQGARGAPRGAGQ